MLRSGTIPNNTIHIPIATVTVTDRGSVNTGLLVTVRRYKYRLVIY